MPYSASGRGRRISPEQRARNRGYGRKAWRIVRAYVLARDRHVCHYCGGRANTADHLVPLSHGGAPYDPRNLVASCGPCNTARVGREMAERARKNSARREKFPERSGEFFRRAKSSAERSEEHTSELQSLRHL